MDEISLLEPIEFIGFGKCLDCGGSIYVMDSEMTFMQVNNDGIPVTEETKLNVKGICSQCGKTSVMMRWNGGYVPYSRTAYIIRTTEKKIQIRERLEKLNGKTKDESNPLIL